MMPHIQGRVPEPDTQTHQMAHMIIHTRFRKLWYMEIRVIHFNLAEIPLKISIVGEKLVEKPVILIMVGVVRVELFLMDGMNAKLVV
jgi:hypothetical protein